MDRSDASAGDAHDRDGRTVGVSFCGGVNRLSPLLHNLHADIEIAVVKTRMPLARIEIPLPVKSAAAVIKWKLDHILPKALGGTDDPANLRPLCRARNLLMAEVVFGREHMEKFQRAPN